MNKKQLFLWSLYDFANSIVYINFILYFATWIVVDAGLSDFWYNAIFAITTVILLFTAPILAARTDLRGGRKYWLNISTIGTFLSYGLVAILAGINNNVLLIALLFLTGQYFYQLSFVFYNPMLDDIADETHKSRVSGIGNFASSLGFVVGILITLPFAGSRITPLLISVPVFFILALPMMIFFKESKKHIGSINTSPIQDETKIFVKKMIAFFAVSAATPMLVAFFFYNDALLTISNNYSIYLERVFHSPDTSKSILLMTILIMSAIGSIIGGWLGDKIGALKTLKFILLGWVITIPVFALAPNFLVVTILTPIMGLLIGSAWTTSRSYLTTVLVKENMGYGFSFYTIAERFATLVGPLTWGGIIWAMGTEALAYRIAAGTMTIFCIIDLIILHRWRQPVILNNQIMDYGKNY
ncbi:MAG: Transporter, major facilitator family [Candidatus Nomurabacteria bacterium GW2011_GWA1_37_20]|uniref:Transporter, major facilitator family n=1 Tax=Candidatus Nomurabacteria bacterium GW2011_GWA1_37_20 TaxID=1618729 RepID=A0A0G0GQQ0_9BACT|nr:MAG: Transporter, major facilitator family [Candidatus Nomurabacteria bacterium GW2011_GWA1_37_20]